MNPCRYDGPYLCAACGKEATPRHYLLPDNNGRGFPACWLCTGHTDIFYVLGRLPREDGAMVAKAPPVCHGTGTAHPLGSGR